MLRAARMTRQRVVVEVSYDFARLWPLSMALYPFTYFNYFLLLLLLLFQLGFCLFLSLFLSLFVSLSLPLPSLQLQLRTSKLYAEDNGSTEVVAHGL